MKLKFIGSIGSSKSLGHYVYLVQEKEVMLANSSTVDSREGLDRYFQHKSSQCLFYF